MGKKIKMTFHAEVPSLSGDYMLSDKISIVDDAERIGSMTHVAAYMIEHAKGFTGYDVEVINEKEAENNES